MLSDSTIEQAFCSLFLALLNIQVMVFCLAFCQVKLRPTLVDPRALQFPFVLSEHQGNLILVLGVLF